MSTPAQVPDFFPAEQSPDFIPADSGKPQLSPPSIAKPNIPVNYEEPAASRFLQDVQQRVGQNIVPALQALKHTGNAIFDSSSPERQEVMTGLQHPFSARRGLSETLSAFPPVQAIGMLRQWSNPANAAGDVLTGVALHQATAGEPSTSKAPAVATESAPSSMPSALGTILKGHIPVIGKYLRTIDDVKALLGKDAPHPTSATNVAAPKEAPVPQTNGIPWGSGGQGPIDLRGKMITQTVGTAAGAVRDTNIMAQLAKDHPEWSMSQRLQEAAKIANPSASPYEVVKLQGAKTPQATGATPQLPEMKPSPSTTVAEHGYDPAKQQMFIKFKNGNTYRYSGVPQEVFDQYSASESHGSFHSQNIKGRYQTDLVSKGKPTPGQKVSQAMNQAKPPQGAVLNRVGESDLDQALRRPSGTPADRSKVAQTKVDSLRMQVANNPGDYNAVSQLRAAEDELNGGQK